MPQPALASDTAPATPETMYRMIFSLGLAVPGFLLGLGVPAAAASVEAQDAVATASEAPIQPGAEESLAALDSERLSTDRAYAASILGHVDRIASAAGTDPEPEFEAWLDSVRLAALVTLERPAEARPVLDRLLRRRPTEAEAYRQLWWTALRMDDLPLAVNVLEQASRTVRSSGWAELRSLVPADVAGQLLRTLSGEREAERVRLARALFHIGWAGDPPGDPGWTDSLRTILLEASLREGDRVTAAEYASGITGVRDSLELIVQPRFDDIFAPGMDRVERLREALREEDRQTAEALALDPGGIDATFDRAIYLRSIAREEEALALLEPFTRDLPAVVASDRLGMWMVNEAARALIALGRDDEAIAMMEQLVALPLDQYPELIGPSINLAGMLVETGHPADALRQVERLDQIAAEASNDYGKMLIATAAVCAFAQLEQPSGAEPWLERMRPNGAEYPEPMLRAHLCVGDLAAAETLLLAQLEEDKLDTPLDGLQNYQLGEIRPALRPFHERLIALRDRPRARARLEQVGRVLSLPLSRSVWSLF